MEIRHYFGKVYEKIKYHLFKISPKKLYLLLITVFAYIQLGEKMNLKNPRTINEKIQWLKINDVNPLKTKLADKYEVRSWVEEKIGQKYLVPLIGVWDSFEDIDFDTLPQRFVLKATHGCGCNIVVLDLEKMNRVEVKTKFEKWMRTNYAYNSGEKHYEKIKPRIVAEEYLENSKGELNDYKVFCFNGKAKYIMYLSDRHTNLKMAFYDTDWVKQPFTYTYPCIEYSVSRPDNLEELISKAETLADGFDIVRVDFYIQNDGSLKFGEMTFASAGGFCRWNPPEYNEILGDMIRLGK